MDSKLWKAWPASCSRVSTSPATPEALVKMKGSLRIGKVVQ